MFGRLKMFIKMLNPSYCDTYKNNLDILSGDEYKDKYTDDNPFRPVQIIVCEIKENSTKELWIRYTINGSETTNTLNEFLYRYKFVKHRLSEAERLKAVEDGAGFLDGLNIKHPEDIQ